MVSVLFFRIGKAMNVMTDESLIIDLDVRDKKLEYMDKINEKQNTLMGLMDNLIGLRNKELIYTDSDKLLNLVDQQNELYSDIISVYKNMNTVKDEYIDFLEYSFKNKN